MIRTFDCPDCDGRWWCPTCDGTGKIVVNLKKDYDREWLLWTIGVIVVASFVGLWIAR